MGKKATVNGFTGGLSLDLNPLTNTKEVLTDAVNASLVTGNGDEMILQNDMGNIKVPNAILPKGYIPIGIKEFGGIAYMALFNPQTGKGQLGTFPSPASYMVNIDFNKDFGYEADGTNIPKELDNLGLEITNGETIEEGTYLIQLRTGDNLDITISPSSDTPLWHSANIENPYKKNKMWDLSWQVQTTSGRVEQLSLKPTKNGNNVKYTASYNGSAGNLVLKVTKNKVSQFTSSCSYISSTNRSKILAYLPTSDIAYNDIKNSTGNILVFISEYIYNCPDGQFDNSIIQGKQSEYIPSNVINGIEYTIGNKKYYFKHHTGTVVNTYDSTNNQFKIQVANIINVSSEDIVNNIITYSSAPVTYNKPQEELRVTGEINTSLAGTNKLFLNTWNYYFDASVNILRWGFEDYLLYGQDIKNLKFTFTDITGKHKVVTIYPTARRTYNGIFTQNNLYENGVVANQIYLCDISFQVQIGGTTYHEYRWLNTSGMYNDAYSNGLQDFGSNEIVKYNTIPLEINLYDSEHVYGTKKTDISGDPLIKTSDNKTTLQQTYTNTIHIDVSTKGIFELQNDMFVLDEIKDASSIIQKYNGIDVTPAINDTPIEYIGNQTTSDYVVNNSTAYINNSAKVSAGKLYTDYDDNNIFLRFEFQNKSAIESQYTTSNTDITFTSFFRPFVVDPYKVKRELCESLMSNYLAFGYELNSDLLPQYYFMDECILKSRKASYYNRFMMDRRSIISDDSVEDSEGVEQPGWQDDSPSITTDLGTTYTRITDEIANQSMSEVSNNTVINKYVSGLGESRNAAKLGEIKTISIGGASDHRWSTFAAIATAGFGLIINLFRQARVNQTYNPTTSRSKTNAIQQGTDFDLFNIYSLQYGNSELLPAFFFWGSYHLTDGLTDTGHTEKDDEGNEVAKTESRTGIPIDDKGESIGYTILPSGIPINDKGEVGTGYTRLTSGITLTGSRNSNDKYLAPFWLNDDLTYTSTNIAYITKWDDNHHNNEVKYIVQAIIDAYKNYYVYTDSDITVPGDNIMFIDVNNVAYTREYTEQITYKDYSIILNSNLLLLNNLQYNDKYKSFLNSYQFGGIYSYESKYSNKTQLLNTGVFKVIGNVSKGAIWTYAQPSMGDEIDKFNSSDSFDYSVLVTPVNDSDDTDYEGNTRAQVSAGTDAANINKHIFKTNKLKPYFTYNNKPFNKYMCYKLSGDTISLYDSKTGYLLPTLVKLSSLTYTTLLLKTKNNSTNISVWKGQGGNLVPNYKNANRKYNRGIEKQGYKHHGGLDGHSEFVHVKYDYLPINLAAQSEIISKLNTTHISSDENGQYKFSLMT